MEEAVGRKRAKFSPDTIEREGEKKREREREEGRIGVSRNGNNSEVESRDNTSVQGRLGVEGGQGEETRVHHLRHDRCQWDLGSNDAIEDLHLSPSAGRKRS